MNTVHPRADRPHGPTLPDGDKVNLDAPTLKIRLACDASWGTSCDDIARQIVRYLNLDYGELGHVTILDAKWGRTPDEWERTGGGWDRSNLRAVRSRLYGEATKLLEQSATEVDDLKSERLLAKANGVALAASIVGRILAGENPNATEDQ